MEELKIKMEKTLERLKNDFSKIRTGRASSSMLDSIQILREDGSRDIVAERKVKANIYNL